MSGKVTAGQVSWSCPRGSKLGFVLIASIGLATAIGGIYKGITSSEAMYNTRNVLVLVAGGLLFTLFAFLVVGSTEIVFDDKAQTIYLKRKRFCSLISFTTKLGPYSQFKQCVVTEGWSHGKGKTRVYSLDFIFNDGTKKGERDSSNGKRKIKIAQEINERWNARNPL